MAVAMMVRFPEDVAEALRERAFLERRSLNRILIDAARTYLHGPVVVANESSERYQTTMAEVDRLLKEARSQLEPAVNQRSAEDDLGKMRLIMEALVKAVAALQIVISIQSAAAGALEQGGNSS